MTHEMLMPGVDADCENEDDSQHRIMFTVSVGSVLIAKHAPLRGARSEILLAKIVEQVLTAKRFLESVGDPVPVTGVVFMGMGEPFDNYERC